MSCNGCRVLRKGCSESCILRPCLQWIDSSQAQAHATVFVAKFFGRAGLMSFLSNVPSDQRPALFQSLLYEACGRTVNPVTGAVGLLWTGNWHVCQAAVDTVLRGGTLRPIPDFLTGAPPIPPTISTTDTGDASEVVCSQHYKQIPTTDSPLPGFTNSKRRRFGYENTTPVDLTLAPGGYPHAPKHRPVSPSLNSEESATTISFEGGGGLECYDVNRPIQVNNPRAEIRLLNLFV